MFGKKKIGTGDLAKDRISGFSGIVVAITEWLNGCRRITIQPQELKDGKPIDSHTFDEPQLDLIRENAFANPLQTAQSLPGGPATAPATKKDPK